ncbi:MAG TPA: flagellar basal-body MS-ring/collar protein FliF [Terriglobales bacterium]|nr:flagellar basal-body MS-ring/collar protein FliF [Terriglobales bacterium]
MNENRSFSQVMSQIGEFLNGMTTRQKLTLGIGAVVVASTLFVFVRLIKKPEYKTLYSGMNAADAQSLGSKLAAKQIDYKVSPDGTTISVPAEALDSARLEVASDGVPNSGRLGFEIFDKTNWGSTDFTEKVNYQRAMEGELEKTIQTLSGVEAVRVHLVLPGEALFVEDKREPKASVIVKLRGGRYTEETHQAISRLVASAVDKLRPENVTVVDADTSTPFNNPSATGDGSASLEQELSNKLVRTLEPVVGSQRVRASVRVEYDLSTSEESQETYDPNTAVALTMQKTEERAGGTSAGGVPGTATNVPGSQASQSAGATNDDSSHSSRSENGTYAVNKIVRHTIVPAGRVKRIAAALLVDDAVEWREQNGSRTEVRRKRTSDEMRQIQELAKAAIGIDATRGDVLAVENLSFQAAPVESPEPPSTVERVRTVVNDWSGALRWIGIAALFMAVYVLFLRPIKKQAVTAFRQLGTRKALPSGKVVNGSNSEVENGTGLQIERAELFDETAPEARRTVALKRHLLDKVKAEPAGASRLVQSWIRLGANE